MSQLKTHADSLTKAELDEFAQEFYGIELDRRKSKGAMTKALIEAAEDKTPLKQLPWEELLLEETPEVVETPASVEPVVQAVVVEQDASFVPLPLSFRRGKERFMIATDTAVKSAQAILADESTISDAKESDLRTVNSILHYVSQDGQVLVRETRNSQFITIK
ncbi:hypothetical protein VPFG_00032 [Vibrio phage nt-1]|uniref:Inh C-terminal domain-containing protein n=1 Tax=Vibrio phage nt-1 TaxID=115992 RepID=R9TIX0_9CAUD|nr:prohead protease inhibitor [Vibrio phage nt-1]AGN30037.1 hypothetical protein VPFG_00032 [Vibrio phage nt-1]